MQDIPSARIGEGHIFERDAGVPGQASDFRRRRSRFIQIAFQRVERHPIGMERDHRVFQAHHGIDDEGHQRDHRHQLACGDAPRRRQEAADDQDGDLHAERTEHGRQGQQRRGLRQLLFLLIQFLQRRAVSRAEIFLHRVRLDGFHAVQPFGRRLIDPPHLLHVLPALILFAPTQYADEERRQDGHADDDSGADGMDRRQNERRKDIAAEVSGRLVNETIDGLDQLGHMTGEPIGQLAQRGHIAFAVDELPIGVAIDAASDAMLEQLRAVSLDAAERRIGGNPRQADERDPRDLDLPVQRRIQTTAQISAQSDVDEDQRGGREKRQQESSPMGLKQF